MAGIDANGLTIKTESELVNEITADFQSAYGDDIDTTPNSPTGQAINIFSTELSLIWLLVQALYNSLDPDTSTGINLDNTFSLVNKPRIAESFSQATVTLGTVGGSPVNVPINSLVSQSAAGEQWETQAAVVIPAFGTIDVLVQAVNPGALTASIGSIDTIDSPLSGWDSVTNAAIESKIGNLEETDPAYRLRVREETTSALAGTLTAVENAVSLVEGVTSVKGEENRTKYFDSNGNLPHSNHLIVEGGLDAEIAQAIFNSIGDGINTNGEIETIIQDSLGNDVPIRFDRPTLVDIYLIVNLTVNASYTGDTSVKNDLIDYFSTLKSGDNILNHLLVGALNDIPGILTIQILQSKINPPVSSNNISIAVNEKARLLIGNITVNS